MNLWKVSHILKKRSWFWSNLALFSLPESMPIFILLDLWRSMRSWCKLEVKLWILNPLFFLRFSMDFRDLWMEIDQLNLQNMNMLLHGCDNAWIWFHHWNQSLPFLKNVRDLRAWDLEEYGRFYTDSSSPQSIERNWVKRLRELRTFGDLRILVWEKSETS